MVSNDFSQIELRDLAHCANATSMIKVYQEGKDIHVFTACAAFKKDYNRYAGLLAIPKDKLSAPDKKDLDHFKQFCRMPAKNLNFLICVGGGQRVITDKGLSPIERVRTCDLVWDGIEWVTHEGVICKGSRPTIHYDGLTATPDHEVWTDGGFKTTLAEAGRHRQRLLVSGDGIYPVVYRESSWPHHALPKPPVDGGDVLVYDILNAGPRRRFTCEGKLVSNCYGATVIGLLAQLALSGLLWSEEEGNTFIDRWFNLYPEVREYMDQLHYRARRYGFIWDIFGRIRHIPEVKSTHSWIKSAGLRQGGNMPIQSCSAGQMNLVMGSTDEKLIQLLDQGVWCWPLLTIHDQLMTEVEEDYAEVVNDIMRDEFSRVMEDQETEEWCFRVPIGCDGDVMSHWVKG